MNKREYHFWANIVEKIHIIVMITYIISVSALFFLPAYRFWGAGYIIFVWVVEAAFGGQCPLTIEERELRRKAGERLSKHQFVSTFFKKYFNMEIPELVWNIVIHGFFALSVLVILYQIMN